MNKRIRELAEQADVCVLGTMTGKKQYTFLEHDLEKFAELIVKECLSYAKDGDLDFMKFMIKQHFGVEE